MEREPRPKPSLAAVEAIDHLEMGVLYKLHDSSGLLVGLVRFEQGSKLIASVHAAYGEPAKTTIPVKATDIDNIKKALVSIAKSFS